MSRGLPTVPFPYSLSLVGLALGQRVQPGLWWMGAPVAQIDADSVAVDCEIGLGQALEQNLIGRGKPQVGLGKGMEGVRQPRRGQDIADRRDEDHPLRGR